MAFIVTYLYGELQTLFEQHKDPRVEHLPMVGSPLPMAGVIIAYLAFVLHYGPKWMENRKPFNLKQVMRLYNAVQVLANSTLFIWGLPNSILRKEFSLTCQPIDHTNTEPWMQRLVYISYGYYMTKYVDLLDTVFFVLRKKNNQITFLHVYHHAGMVFGVYVFMTFMAGSHCTMLGVINLFIHTIMYSYYFVTSLRPVKRALWWKRHITQLQLLQFGYLMLHFMLVIVRNECQHPVLVAFVGLIQNLFMFALFFDFYYKEYMRKPQRLEQQRLLKEDKATEECHPQIQQEQQSMEQCSNSHTPVQQQQAVLRRPQSAAIVANSCCNNLVGGQSSSHAPAALTKCG